MFVKLTEKAINNLRTPRGGWTNKQLDMLGVHTPPVKGWKSELIGKDITQELYDAVKAAGVKARPNKRTEPTRRSRRENWKAAWARYEANPKKRKTVRRKNDKFYNSWEWTTLRYKVLKRYGRRCMCCGATPETGATLHVDHIRPRSKFPELELEIDNLQVLCGSCNKGKGAWDATDFRPREEDALPEGAAEHMREIMH